ncbi:hypothetical protein [Halosimplex carlsbadense]|nr:hypothetical protein [Halosimplex carlsbadense]
MRCSWMRSSTVFDVSAVSAAAAPLAALPRPAIAAAASDAFR